MTTSTMRGLAEERVNDMQDALNDAADAVAASMNAYLSELTAAGMELGMNDPSGWALRRLDSGVAAALAHLRVLAAESELGSVVREVFA